MPILYWRFEIIVTEAISRSRTVKPQDRHSSTKSCLGLEAAPCLNLKKKLKISNYKSNKKHGLIFHLEIALPQSHF